MGITKRDREADLLKGFAILLVVMAHVLLFSAAPLEQYTQTGYSGIIERCISSFHMPLFFFVSGMLLGYKPMPNTWKNTGMAILHKGQTLILPAIIFFLIRHVVSGGWYMDWFLKSLFLIFVIFYIARCGAQKLSMPVYGELIMHAVICVAAIGISIFWKSDVAQFICFHRSATAYPYVAAGYFFTIYNGKEYLKLHNWVVSLSLILFVLSFYAASFVLSGRAAIYSIMYIVAPAAILVCMQLAISYVASIESDQTKEQYRWSRHLFNTLSFCGKHSLSIYVMHMFFMIECADMFRYIYSVPQGYGVLLQVVFGLAGAIPIIALCLAIEWVIAQSALLNFICFGKSPIKQK